MLNKTDIKIYKAILHILKNGISLSISSVAREADVDRKTVRNKIEKFTYQDLEKYRLSNDI